MFKLKRKSKPTIPLERCAHCYQWSGVGMIVIDVQGGTTYPLCQRCAQSVGQRIDAPEVQKRIRAYVSDSHKVT